MVFITSTDSHTVNGHRGNSVDKATGSSTFVKKEEENDTTGNPMEASSAYSNKPATPPTSDNEQAGSDDSNGMNGHVLLVSPKIFCIYLNVS